VSNALRRVSLALAAVVVLLLALAAAGYLWWLRASAGVIGRRQARLEAQGPRVQELSRRPSIDGDQACVLLEYHLLAGEAGALMCGRPKESRDSGEV
jgi:hypothetical protein